MKHAFFIQMMVLSIVLVLAMTGCGTEPADQPVIDVDATVASQVRATLAANKSIAAATVTAASTVDVVATVEAAVQQTVQAQPTSTAQPTDTPTEIPDATATPSVTPTDPPRSPIEVSTAVPADAIPSGKWSLRSYKTDDAAVIWLNGELVGATTGDRNDSNWININDYLLPGQDNIVAFASYNGAFGGKWGFGIRRDDVSVWGVEQETGDDWSFAYAQQVAIHPDGTVEALAPDTSARKPPPGKWYIRAQNSQDIGSVLVNGQPVTAFWNAEADWVDITGLLDSTQDNTVTFAAWNFEGPYSWNFAIKHGAVIVWGKQNSGSGSTNQVYREVVTISPQGDVVEAQPSGDISDYTWSLRSYNTDDAAVIWLNGELVGATTGDRNDSNWININDYLLPDQDNIVAFASYNGAFGGKWGFDIRRDDISVWGIEQETGDDWSFAYAQQVAIHPDGTVEALAPDTSARKPPPGKWYIRAQNSQDIGSILVNGQPVAAFWNQPADWIDITGLLDSTRDNTITFAAWNFEGPYAWDFAIKHDEDIPWAVSNSGSGQAGVVLQQNVIITGDGNVVQAAP